MTVDAFDLLQTIGGAAIWKDVSLSMAVSSGVAMVLGRSAVGGRVALLRRGFARGGLIDMPASVDNGWVGGACYFDRRCV